MVLLQGLVIQENVLGTWVQITAADGELKSLIHLSDLPSSAKHLDTLFKKKQEQQQQQIYI